MSRADFRQRIRASLANPALQAALDANAERRVHGRAAAFASLPDWPERRQRAHAVRAEVIEHLEDYLAEFTRRAEGNGIVVHRAKDAAEAIGLILEIVEASLRRDTKEAEGVLVAKSKSMVSEEIELNGALEAAGVRVVETDLGEYIVQLRGERPAHIITPAVHLRRQEVGQLFHEKLGLPYTEDIPALTGAAREVLRQVFLRADVGISGVNFGVAATGTLCLVTNEGNGRMVTTLPPLHIALMGMERLVPGLDDLALMLSLLARSATTQKISVYTQLIHAPLPGQQRHLVILDNGRTRLRNSPLRESLYCIRCGACLNACPVFREIGGHGYASVYPGPIGSVISAGLFGADFVPLAQASSLCGACKEACPVDIDLPKLLTRVRAGGDREKRGRGKGERGERKEERGKEGDGLSGMGRAFMQVYSLVARRPRLFAAAQGLAALGTRLAAPFGPYVRMPARSGWGYSKDLPRFAARPFRARFARLEMQQGTRPVPAERDIQGEGHKAQPAEQGPADPSPLVSRFAEELKSVNGNVICAAGQDLTASVIGFLQQRQVDAIHLEPGLLDESALRAAGIAVSRVPDPGLRVGVTRAICGLAETGSILVVDGEGDPLQASLLPRIHLAVLRRSDLLPSLADALRLPIVRQSRASVVISGPSRTADIEMSLTIGMHGPGELHVFLVDDSPYLAARESPM